MKKFILHFFFFIATVIIFLLLFDSIISSQLRKSDSVIRNIVWKEIFSGDLKNDVVVMGSSRAAVQYNPIILDSLLHTNSYNLGCDGRAINTQILRYNTYTRLNGKPKLIIQNIDLMTIEQDNAYCREQFFPYFFDKTFRDEVVELENLGFADKYIPSYRYAGYFHKILSWIGIIKKENSILVKGYHSNDLEWDGSNLSKHSKITYGQDSLSLSNFENYINQAKQDSIEVLFVYAPIYIEATKLIHNIDDMYTMFDSIAVKYNIPILDYNYSDISYNKDNFYNATHLNSKGAELFSTRLALDIDSLQIGILQE